MTSEHSPNDVNKLSIYDDDVNKADKTPQSSTEDDHKKVLTAGFGKRIMSVFTRSKNTVSCLRMDARSLKEYALTTEGKVKLSSMAICTSVFGIYGIFTTKSRFKRLLYPLTGFALSSSVCYPSTAYKISKASAIKANEVSQTGWAHTKYGYEVMKEKYFSEVDEEDEDVSLEETKPEGVDVAKSMDVPNMFELPKEDKIKTIETSSEEAQKASELPSVQTSNTLVEAISSPADEGSKVKDEVNRENEVPLADSRNMLNLNFDYGQSAPDDKELYTTRS